MDGACVSSKSSPCARAPLARAAIGAATRRVPPTTVELPSPPHARAGAVSASAHFSGTAARAQPSVSSTRRATLSRTATGIPAGVNDLAKQASRSAELDKMGIAFPILGHIT